jgi:DNA-binding protein HU-beta
MTEGKNIYLRGFGSFIVKKRKTKVARNISAGTQVIIPEHYIPFFKPCKRFLNRVKNNVKK